MKFYNPFCLHLMQIGDKYAVRRWRWFWWEYMDMKRPGVYWWSSNEHVTRYCLADTEEQARAAYAKIRPVKVLEVLQ